MSSWNEKRKILVYGYVRLIENKLQIIPNDIKNLIYSFQQFCDIWDKIHNKQNIRKKRIIIDEERICVTSLISTTAVIFGNEVIKTGIYEWIFQINKITKSFNQNTPWIGIIEDNTDIINKHKTNGAWQSNGYLFCGGTGQTFTKSGSQKYGTNWNKKGDIIKMIVDLDNYNIKFIINNKDYGFAFKNIQKKKYRMALCIYGGVGTQIELL